MMKKFFMKGKLMRLRKKWWAVPEMKENAQVIFNAESLKGKWNEEFKNTNPINLELGCGKGKFISEIADVNKNINYCILDLDTNAIVYATRKIRDLELSNVRAIPTNIEKIDEIFSENSISRIYINFCNPWPKKRHHKRRLTHPNFLAKYNKLLIEEGEIHFKTDDDDLFKASLEYFNENGFEVILITYDLANFDYPKNIETEYENKFKSLGINIKFLIAKKK